MSITLNIIFAGDLFDIMALASSSVTFILYCSMSAQFRTAFQKMFKFDVLSDFLRRRRNADGADLNGKRVSNTELTCMPDEKRPVNVEANIPDSAGVRV